MILRATRRVSIEGRRVLTDVYQPALSPDGTQIGYFDGMGDHSHNLWVMNADGTERRLLLDHEVAGPGHMYALTWSPDGEWLAFQTDNRIYLVRPDGTGLRPVVEGFFIAASAVQWSPDGSRIAYLRGGALSIVNVDGGDERSSSRSVRHRSRGTPPCDALICTSDRDGWDGGSGSPDAAPLRNRARRRSPEGSTGARRPEPQAFPDRRARSEPGRV